MKGKFQIGDIVVRDSDVALYGEYDETHPRLFKIYRITGGVAFPEEGNGTYLEHLRPATPLEKALL